MTDRTIADGLRTLTVVVAAAVTSTASPALSMNRRPVRSKVSREGAVAVIGATAALRELAFDMSISPDTTTIGSPAASTSVAIGDLTAAIVV